MYGIVTTTRKMDRKDRTVCTWLGQSFLNTYETMRSNAVVAKTAAHILLLASRCRTQR